MPKHPPAADIPALIAKLSDAGVEFIIVGGVAGILQGAPLTTTDLDIVHRQTPENIDRLLDVMRGLGAIMRYDFERRNLPPTAEMLAGRGQINLSTALGPIDPLCQIDSGKGYEDLLEHSRIIHDEDRTLRVLDLPTLIEVKSRTGRPKDRIALPILIATLQERTRREQAGA